jgi:flagellar biosynthetic protein FliR
MPFEDLVPLFPLVVPFLLVLFRVLGVFSFVAFFSNVAIPGNVKVLLALCISVCIFSSVPHAVAMPASLPSLVISILGELSVGLLMGMMVSLVFNGLQLGAHMISQQMGLSLAGIYDPMFDQESTAIEQVSFWLGTIVFISLGGHAQLINAIVYSYDAVPIGHAVKPEHLLEVGLASVTSSFHLAVKIGAPALVAFFVSTLAMGFIGKSMPQINIMSMGISMHLIIGFGMIAVGMVGWAVVAREAWLEFFARLAMVFGHRLTG